MVDTIYRAKGIPRVRVKWANNFIKRTLALTIKLRRVYECQRKLYEDLEIIRGWFKLVKNTINKYSILLEDTYNFNKAGF
jgi:hypothetical protein